MSVSSPLRGAALNQHTEEMMIDCKEKYKVCLNDKLTTPQYNQFIRHSAFDRNELNVYYCTTCWQ